MGIKISDLVDLPSLDELSKKIEDGLFPSDPYIVDRAIADRLTITFTGSLTFEAGDPEGEALFSSLELGKEVEVRAAGVVVSKSGRYSRAKDDAETITGVASIKLESLYLPRPEQLT